jgi:hypothetical protein
MRCWYTYYHNGRYPPSAYIQTLTAILLLPIFPLLIVRFVVSHVFQLNIMELPRSTEWVIGMTFCIVGTTLLRFYIPESQIIEKDLSPSEALRGRIIFITLFVTTFVGFLIVVVHL